MVVRLWHTFNRGPFVAGWYVASDEKRLTSMRRISTEVLVASYIYIYILCT